MRIPRKKKKWLDKKFPFYYKYYYKHKEFHLIQRLLDKRRFEVTFMCKLFGKEWYNKPENNICVEIVYDKNSQFVETKKVNRTKQNKTIINSLKF